MTPSTQSAKAAHHATSAKMRGAESAYQMAISTFGVDSAEAQAAFCYWQALRRKSQIGFAAWA